jgi:hypothetical protein
MLPNCARGSSRLRLCQGSRGMLNERLSTSLSSTLVLSVFLLWCSDDVPFNYWCYQDHESAALADGHLLCVARSSSKFAQDENCSLGDTMGVESQ